MLTWSKERMSKRRSRTRKEDLKEREGRGEEGERRWNFETPIAKSCIY